MSWQCTSWALREAPCPTATSRLVLIALADRCQPDGRSAWPTVDTLMLEAHCSESTVLRSLHELEAAGVIRRGNQALAAYDEHGRFLPPQYRPIVWECCMHVQLEQVAQKPGRQAREHKAAQVSSRSVDAAVTVRPVKMTGLEESGVQTCQNDTSRPVTDDTSRPVTGDTSRPVTSDRSIYKTNINKQINPYNPLAASRTSPQGKDLDDHSNSGLGDDAVRQVVDRLMSLRKAAGLSVGVTRRDVPLVRQVVEQHGVTRVLEVLDWVYIKQSSRWWVQRTRTAASFARVFDELVDAWQLDTQRAKAADGRSVVAVAGDAVRVQVSSALGERYPRPCVERQYAQEAALALLGQGLSVEQAVRRGIADAVQRLERERRQVEQQSREWLCARAVVAYAQCCDAAITGMRDLASDGQFERYQHQLSALLSCDQVVDKVCARAGLSVVELVEQHKSEAIAAVQSVIAAVVQRVQLVSERRG